MYQELLSPFWKLFRLILTWNLYDIIVSILRMRELYNYLGGFLRLFSEWHSQN